jgi:hypothetical protein
MKPSFMAAFQFNGAPKATTFSAEPSPECIHELLVAAPKTPDGVTTERKPARSDAVRRFRTDNLWMRLENAFFGLLQRPWSRTIRTP